MIEAASTIVAFDQSRAPGALQLLAAKDPPTQPASTVTGSTRPIFMSSSTSARWLRSYLRTPVLRVSIASDGSVSQTHYHSKTEAASMTLCGGEALWRCGAGPGGTPLAVLVGAAALCQHQHRRAQPHRDVVAARATQANDASARILRETMRHAARNNKERWKTRRTPTQHPSTDLLVLVRVLQAHTLTAKR